MVGLAPLTLVLLAEPAGLALEAALFAAEPAALSAGQLVGFSAGGAYNLGPWVLGLSLEVGQASADDLSHHLEHLELRLGAAVGYTWPVGRGELNLSLGAGPLLLHERRERHQAARLERAGLPVTEQTWAGGGLLRLGLAARLFLHPDWALVVAFGPSASWAPVEDGPAVRPGWFVSLGALWAADRGRSL